MAEPRKFETESEKLKEELYGTACEVLDRLEHLAVAQKQKVMKLEENSRNILNPHPDRERLKEKI